MNQAEQLLQSKGIRNTPIRSEVLHLLMQSAKAYSHADLEQAFDNSLDRVSLYRCLNTLIRAGLVQKRVDSKGYSCFFYAPMSLTAVQPYFKCSQCETVISLPELPRAYLKVVRQFQIDTIQLLAEGTCDTCRHVSSGNAKQTNTKRRNLTNGLPKHG